MITTWIRMWDLREAPTVQALVRILLGAVLWTDLFWIGWLDLQVPLFAPVEAGGWSVALERPHPPWWYTIFPLEPWSARALWVGLLLSSSAFTMGWWTRSSALVLVLLSAQAALLLPPADRGIDRLIRNVLLVFAFSGAGRTMSVDARLTTGRWTGDGASVPAWPRHLLVLQLAVMYFTAGVYKAAYLWTPMGKFDALYVILQDPAVARADWSWLVDEPFLLLTRIGTAMTVTWEWTALLPLWVFWWRFAGTRSRGALFAVEKRLHLVWLSIGVMFHLGIALTLDLGIFPWAMLALYPVFLHPDELRAVTSRISAACSAKVPATRSDHAPSSNRNRTTQPPPPG